MKKFLVIGNPIDHSLSPKLHNYWIKKNKLNSIYGKLEINDNEIGEICDNLKQGKNNFILKIKKDGIKKKVNPVSRGRVVPGPIKS